MSETIEWEPLLENDDATVGLVELDGRPPGYDSVPVRTRWLLEAARLADEVGWERVDVAIKQQRPVFLERVGSYDDDEPTTGFAIAPLVPDDWEGPNDE